MKTILQFKAIILILVLICSAEGFSQVTEMVKDISTSTSSGISSETIKFKNHIYFTQNEDDLEPYKLWKTNGDENGTTKVQTSDNSDIFNANNFIIMNNELYFTVYNDNLDYELWKTDGTSSTAEMVKDLSTAQFKNPSHFFALDSFLMFKVFENGIGYRLVKSDGQDVTLVTGLFKYQDITPKAVLGNYLYFGGEYVNNGTSTGVELCRTNGAGASMVKDIAPGNLPNTTIALSSDPTNFEKVGNELFFIASTFMERQLWKTDGTNYGTKLVKGIGAAPNFNYLTAVGNDLFFIASTSTEGSELWKSDGTTNGTAMVKDINGAAGGSNVKNLFDYNGTLLFSGNDGSGNDLWKSDGTAAGTQLLSGSQIGPSKFTIAKNEVYFAANTFSEGTELWKTDGTAAGTGLVEDIYAVSNFSSEPDLFNSLGNLLIFSANDGTGEEVWKHNPCNLTPIFSTVDVEIDETFISAGMPSGALATEEGVYQDTLRNSLDCDSIISTFTLTKVSATGISNLNFESIKVFPNPTNGIINLSVSEKLSSIKIINLTGKTIKVFNAENSQLDISEFTAGIYFLEIANAERKSVVKIIKK